MQEFPSLSLVAGVEPALHEDRIARHAEAEQPEHEAGKDEAGHRRLRRRPVGVGEALPDDAEQVEDADDADQARVLEQADEGVDDARDDELQRLRQDDQPHLLPVAEAERIGALVLALGDRLQAAAHHLGHVGRGEQRHADQRAQQLVEVDARRQEQRQHHACHEQHGDQRHAAHDLDEDDRDHLDDRQLRAPAERQQDAERQRDRRCRRRTAPA